MVGNMSGLARVAHCKAGVRLMALQLEKIFINFIDFDGFTPDLCQVHYTVYKILNDLEWSPYLCLFCAMHPVCALKKQQQNRREKLELASTML
ncbi:hypothetical protein Y1Q_0022585 [Alligator mississippiensis]|uniref:Uncharacterized protein n=1 Tax=Alligator mississippiensis TaxID=8496 RepID=A0A151NQL0_ALLMI|nr:hypothetical protein Y1Q_0022585 [Alligator mississippiensis]